ncbi:MAG TPA: acyltransferase [Pedococcus sp.]|jgi:peptidoglycan/LPS O-acetylase OafA/YrhL
MTAGPPVETPVAAGEAPATTTATARAPQGHLRELEGLRAVAAGAVLLTHAGFLSGATGRDVLPGLLARMDIGVSVFFVLSGFLLYTPHARANAGTARRPSLTTFALRRTARLVPAWLLVLAATPLLVPAARDAGVQAWLANLAQLQSLRFEWVLPGLAQLWSLSTEVMFYLALPFVALAVGRLTRGRPGWTEPALLLALLLGAQAFRALARAGVLPESFTWHQTLFATFDWFAWGMLLAVVAAREAWRQQARVVLTGTGDALLVLAASLFWVLTTRLAGPYDLTVPTTEEDLLKHVGYGLVALLLVLPSALGVRTVLSGPLAHPVMDYLGKISYAVFLWHMPIMFAVRDVLDLRLFGGGFWLTVVVTTAVTLPVAAASWHVVEGPAQRWVRARTGGAPRTLERVQG